MPNSTFKKDVPPVAQGLNNVTGLEINFVSTCPQGANAGAKVLLKKEHIMSEDKTKKDGEATTINVDLASLTKGISGEIQAVVKGLLEKKDALSAEVMTEAVVASMAKSLTAFKVEIEKGLTDQLSAVRKELETALAEQKNVTKEHDEVLKMGEKVFRKSEVGAAAFDALAHVHKEQLATETRLNKERLEMRVEKEYPHVAGKPEDKALILKAIEDLPDSGKSAGLALLKALNDAGQNATKEHGHNGNNSTGTVSKTLNTDTDASLQLDKMAADYAKEKGISKSAAYDAVAQTPEGMALYNQHRMGVL